MKSLQLHGDHLVMGIRKVSQWLSLYFCLFIFGHLFGHNISHLLLLAIKFELESTGFEEIRNKIRILFASKKQSSDVEYVTNNTHHIPLLNSLSFHIGLFVYLIMLLTGQLLLSFYNLSQAVFFLCSIFQ